MSTVKKMMRNNTTMTSEEIHDKINQGMINSKKPFYVMKYKTSVSEHYPFYDITETKTKWPFDVKIKKGQRLNPLIRDALPIRPTSVCKFIGIMNRQIIRGKQKVYRFSPGIVHSYFYGNSAMRHSIVDKIKLAGLRIRVEGNWPSQIQTFIDNTVPSKSKTTAMEYIEACEKRLDKIYLPEIPDLINPMSVINYPTNPKSNSGLLSSILIGNNHEESDYINKPLAADVLKQIEDGKTIYDRSIYTIGGRARNQKVDFDNIGDELKSRVVMVPEAIPKIVSGATIAPFYKSMINNIKNFPENEICIGLDYKYTRYDKFDDKNRNYDKCIEMDWKGYDSTLDEELILASIALIRGCYPAGKKYDDLFLYIAGNIILKNVAIQQGFVYSLMKALPSGTPLTTPIGSVGNWLANCVLYKDLPAKDIRFVCYGDDTQIWLNVNGYGDVEPEKYLSGIIEGNISKIPLIPKDYKIFDLEKPRLDIYDGPSLLKSFSDFGCPARKKEDLYENLIYGGTVNKFSIKEYSDVDSIFEIFERSLGAYYNSPYNMEVIKDLREWQRLLLDTYFDAYGKYVDLYDQTAMREIAFRRIGVNINSGMRQYTILNLKNFTNSKADLPWIDKEKFVEDKLLMSKSFNINVIERSKFNEGAMTFTNVESVDGSLYSARKLSLAFAFAKIQELRKRFRKAFGYLEGEKRISTIDRFIYETLVYH